MPTPSKFGAAFLTVFGLPFLGMGLLFAMKSLLAPDQPVAARIGGAMFGAVFAIIGAGLIFGALKGYSQLSEQSERASANPDSPWLWRKDWAARRIESHNKTTAIAWWVAAVLVNMISLPISLAAYSQLSRIRDPRYIVPAAFELLGLILLFAAIRATIRFDRFGKTYFEMNSLPYSPGGHVSGAIHAQIPGDAPHGIDLTLSCLRRITTGSGNSRSTQEVPLWEDSKNIASASLARGPLDTVIPVDFAIPPDALETDRINPSDQVYWMLKAKADVPGVNYADQFELPVFRTSQSMMRATPPAAEDFDIHGGRFGRFASTTMSASEASAADAAEDVAEPTQHRVVVQDSPDGLEFSFRAARNLGRTLLILVLTAAITAFFVAMLRLDRRAPLFAFAIVGLLDAFLVLALIHTALSSTRILVGNGMISWKRSVLGLGFSRQAQISDVDSIAPVTSIQQASSGGSTLYSLRLRSKNGTAQTLVDDIESRQEARWIVSQIAKRAGLALNTQVEVSNSIYGPPPQVAASATAAGADDFASYADRARAASRTGSNLSHVIGAIFFAVWLGFFGLMIFRITGARKARTRSAASSAAASGGSVRTQAMQQASLEEVVAFPAQQQAEELLARSVEHDPGALQLLARNTPAWAGHIQRTNHLDQLENQARYSNDLRVRRAEADLELAADGCQKNSSCVDVLMDHARTDPSDRALALYELGILAGDGVESERVHPFVLNYARNDSDPAVRRWATEGLRFVGTDAALDELFDIFTHDPSFAVRDRAGCNISDCGIFQRKQRFRMVPRLIDLAADPQINPQMSGWCFMALREITGESLPADAGAWRRWYAANGPAKRAQFDALNWWEVPGDN